MHAHLCMHTHARAHTHTSTQSTLQSIWFFTFLFGLALSYISNKFGARFYIFDHFDDMMSLSITAVNFGYQNGQQNLKTVFKNQASTYSFSLGLLPATMAAWVAGGTSSVSLARLCIFIPSSHSPPGQPLEPPRLGSGKGRGVASRPSLRSMAALWADLDTVVAESFQGPSEIAKNSNYDSSDVDDIVSA